MAEQSTFKSAAYNVIQRMTNVAANSVSPTQREPDSSPEKEIFDPTQSDHFTKQKGDVNDHQSQGLSQHFANIHSGLTSFDFSGAEEEDKEADGQSADHASGAEEDDKKADGQSADDASVAEGGGQDGDVTHVLTKQTGLRGALRRNREGRQRQASQKALDAKESEKLAGPNSGAGGDPSDSSGGESGDDDSDESEEDGEEDGEKNETTAAESDSTYHGSDEGTKKNTKKATKKKKKGGGKKRKSVDPATNDSDYDFIRDQLAPFRKSIAPKLKLPDQDLVMELILIMTTKPGISNVPKKSLMAFTNDLVAQGSKRKRETFIFPPKRKKRAKTETATKGATKRSAQNTSESASEDEKLEGLPNPKQRETQDLHKFVLGSHYTIGKNEEALLMHYRPKDEDADDDNWKDVTTPREATDLKKKIVDSEMLDRYGIGPEIASNLPSTYILAPQIIVHLGRPSPQSELARFAKKRDVICGINKEWVEVHGGNDVIPTKITKNDLVYLNGYDVRLINKWVYFVGAYKVEGGVWGQKVGYVKCLPQHLHLILNRCAQVTSVATKGKSGSALSAIYRTVGGVAQISFLDVGVVQDKRWMNRAKKATGLGKAAAKHG